jgi:hypothetical protein
MVAAVGARLALPVQRLAFFIVRGLLGAPRLRPRGLRALRKIGTARLENTTVGIYVMTRVSPEGDPRSNLAFGGT